jgi:hypothetical protein
MFSRSSYNSRNVVVKSIISVLTGAGIFLAMYATISCRWFVFDDTINNSTGNNSVENDSLFSFLPSINSTASVGLFRYQTKIGDGRIIEDEPNILATSTILCTQYDPLFQLGTIWMFTAQICVILGPIFAFVAWLLAMIGVNKHPAALFLLLATSVQAASVISSMTLCDKFWDCPWLLGSLSDVVATALFFLSWLLALCGLMREEAADDDEDDDHDEQSRVKSRMTGGGTDDGGDHPSILAMTDEESQAEKLWYQKSSSSSSSATIPAEEEYQSSKDTEKKKQELSAVELLGTNDPIITRAISQTARMARDMVSRVNKTAKYQQGENHQTVKKESKSDDEKTLCASITDPTITLSENDTQTLV